MKSIILACLTLLPISLQEVSAAPVDGQTLRSADGRRVVVKKNFRKIPGFKPRVAITLQPSNPQAVIKEDCVWTDHAQCDYWDCDSDDVCILLKTACYDHYGNPMSCG